MGEFVPEPPLWEQMSSDEGERLQKVLARAGFGSRRVCEQLIEADRVCVNGDVAVLGRRVVVARDVVTVDDVPIVVDTTMVYYLMNKPSGVICSASDPHHDSTILDLVPRSPRVFTVGRLDKDSEGLILLTNDGEFAQRMSHPSMGVDKEYLVHVGSSGRRVSTSAISSLRRGVELDDGLTAPAQVSELEPGVLRMIIHEGRNRQIRRMCSAVGYEVVRLVRTRIGSLRDASLAPGKYRLLEPQEVYGLLRESLATRSDASPDSASE